MAETIELTREPKVKHQQATYLTLNECCACGSSIDLGQNIVLIDKEFVGCTEGCGIVIYTCITSAPSQMPCFVDNANWHGSVEE